jgi:hypothetical protein
MDREARRARIAEIVAARLEQGDPVGWFDDLYRDAEGDEQKVR